MKIGTYNAINPILTKILNQFKHIQIYAHVNLFRCTCLDYKNYILFLYMKH